MRIIYLSAIFIISIFVLSIFTETTASPKPSCPDVIQCEPGETANAFYCASFTCSMYKGGDFCLICTEN